MKLFVLIVVLVMANGVPKTNSTLIEQCPDSEVTSAFFNAKVEAGEIRGWHALCVETPLSKGATT